MSASILAKRFRNVLILDSRNWIANCGKNLDPGQDLVLTFDLGLKREIEAQGGCALYVDHLVDVQTMHSNNFVVESFLHRWHLDVAGSDLFTYLGVPFGTSFKLEFWTDYIFYVKMRLCLERLRETHYDALFVGVRLGVVEEVLGDLALPFKRISLPSSTERPSYYFQIHAWMQANIRRRGLKACILNSLTLAFGMLFSVFDVAFGLARRRPGIFVQQYHPTRPLLRILTQDPKVRVVAAAFSKDFMWSRFIPVTGSLAKFSPIGRELMTRFRDRRSSRLVLTNGADVTDAAYRIIERAIEGRVTSSLRTLDAILRYLDKVPFHLAVLIANIGDVVSLVDCACRHRKIPTYLIINGLMTAPASEESKFATTINAYSASFKNHYFRSMSNIVCLGDPRMDAYTPLLSRRKIDKRPMFIAIGASGFSNIELNSYVAVEFDFIFDVLVAIQRVKTQGLDLRVTIKVRPNGYLAQYQQLAGEYFPGLVDEIVDRVPMRSVLEGADFYISSYSQTLFEASCLGIPCLYYRKDKEVMYPPFDSQSELVTVDCIDDLVDAINDARAGHPRYDAFLTKSVMETYVGPLDGGNCQRNLDFIYKCLGQRADGKSS